MTAPRLAVLASGRGTNLQSILDAAAHGSLGAKVVLAVSDRKGAPALQRARRAGVSACFLDPSAVAGRAGYDRALCDLLLGHDVELVALAGFMRILGPDLIDRYPQRIMNVHPSLLPAFPGLNAPQQAIDHGVKVSGCTVHFIDHGIDTGPIILQEAVPVLPGDDAGALQRRIQVVEHRLFPQAIGLYSRGSLRIKGRQVDIV
ncbi:MAG: phosphoribosylglycinamide formyltransferase [Thermaerobacterales bacterium]